MFNPINEIVMFGILVFITFSLDALLKMTGMRKD